jgi:hypothetical protein
VAGPEYVGGADGLSIIGLHPWRVVLRGSFGVVGAGVLVDPWHVLTCAHVVTNALGSASDGGAPEGELTVVLPFGPAGTGADPLPVEIPAHVHPSGWAPVSTRGGGDLALLRLRRNAPAGHAVARLARMPQAAGRRVGVFGHPSGLDDGVWALAEVTGVAGPSGEWLQLDATQPVGRPVTQGFSGAGAVDAATGEVLGIVVAQDVDAVSRVAWMIRIETVVAYLPFVAGLLHRAGAPKADDSPAGPVVGGMAVRRLTDREWQQLFERLWAVPGMSERSSRDLYLRLLEQRSPTGLSSPRHAEDRLDLWELMQALVARPGSLRDLVAVVRTVQPQSRDVEALEEFVERTFPDLLLEHAERVRLEELLRGVAPSWVATAMSSATADMALPPAAGQRSVAEAVRVLEEFGRVRGGPPPPLLVFVDDLAHAIGGNTGAGLHRWIDDVAVRLDISRVDVHRLCQAAGRRRAELAALWLMVHLEPDRADPDRYFMSALLMCHDRTERVLHRDDVARTLPELSRELDDVLAAVPEGLDEQPWDPMIEFVLPRRLLGEPVDEWEFGRSGFALPLGLRYPVVVRSLDRMRNPGHHADWWRKSRRLTEAGHRVNPDALHCFEPPRDQRPDSARVLFARLTGHEQVVALAVPHPPDASVPMASDPFEAGLAAGLPAVLWAREPVDPDEFFHLVRTALADVPLEIPLRVLRHRREVMANPGRRGLLAAKVGVIFDVADRVPRQFREPMQLKAPW